MVLAFATCGRYNTRLFVTVSTRRRHDRAWAEIDLANLVANARTIQQAAGCDALLPMVKADAYGLGVAPVVRALDLLDPWGFGLATIAEAVALRDMGVRRRLVVFTPARTDLLSAYRAYDLRAVIDDPSVASAWSHPFHVEIDTGMGRCGVRWDDAAALRACASPHLEGVFTHFHSADTDVSSVETQWQRFQTSLDAFDPRPPLVHAANSAAAWRLPEPLDLVRPGIFLYGGVHGDGLPSPRGVVTVRAPVVSVRRVAKGDTVSYGASWVAPRTTVIATVAIGYADGVGRAVSPRAHVLVRGQRRPIVGRVTMDFVMVALDPDDPVMVGDAVTVIGREGAEEITVEEFAEWSGTNNYEVLARIGPRVERHYRGP